MKLIDYAWETIKAGFEQCRNEYEGVIFHEERKKEFEEKFRTMYDNVMERFMRPDVRALDSHKQAAILTISCLESNLIEHELIDGEDKISIAPQMIAVNVGLSYMKDCMNENLRKKKIGKKIDKYYLPVALACNTKYQDIVCRILYYEQYESDMSFNVLELSDRYFLLEYINLLQRGIEPYLLKEDNV